MFSTYATMDAIVQLIRNALCCVKDLNMFQGTIVHDKSYTANQIYDFPSPHMSETTPLELSISISQLYACISCSRGGLKLITTEGIHKLQRLIRVTTIYSKSVSTTNSKKLNKSDEEVEKIVEDVMRSSFVKEANDATKNVLLGISLLSTGISFFWLFANSLHITPTGLIGGLPALIHALTVMEIALVVFLYSMVVDAIAALRKSSRIKRILRDEKVPAMSLETYTLLCDESSWIPFYATGASSHIEKDAEERMFKKELETVRRNMKSFMAENTMNDQKVLSLADHAQETKWEGYLQIIFFILNFIAFYGYLLGVVVYYFDDEKNQPSYVTALKFGYSNEYADWAGNFAGDLMWTIEPIIILATPYMMSLRKNERSSKKMKED